MGTKKFKLLKSEKINHNGHTLYRIQALKDFSDVKKGDVGGWVEKEENLSHKGNCWIYNSAKAYDDSKVFENAKIMDYAEVFGQARVSGQSLIQNHARVFDGAIVTCRSFLRDYSYVCGETRLLGNVELTDSAMMCGNSCVHGNIIARDKVVICGNVEIWDRAIFLGDAYISRKTDYYCGCEFMDNGYPFTYTRSNDMWQNINTYGTREDFLKTLNKIVPYKVPFYIKVMDFVEDLLNDSNCSTHQA